MNIIQKYLGNIRPYNGVKTPAILQFAETECGIAALAILFAYYKTNITLEELREKCGSGRDGCKATTLMSVAKQYGFEVAGYKVEVDDIVSLQQPVIAFWNFSHYVIINGVGNNKVFINDPAHGPLSVTM